jgi:predicted RND superfamily exporter protein
MMRKRILQGISHLCLHHYRKVLLIFLGLLAIAFLLTGNLRFDPDFMKLFPAERGPIKLYMENLKETGTFDLLFVLLEREEGVALQEFIDSGVRIAEGLKGLDVSNQKAFKSVRYQKIEPEDLDRAKSALTLFLSHPYLFLDEEDIPALRERWSAEEISKQIRKNRRVLVSQASFAMKDLIQIDPFEMRWLFMEKWRRGVKGMEFDESSPLFLSKDGKTLLIITEPVRPATDLSFSYSLMEALNRFASSTGQKNVSLSFTGAHPIATAEAKTLRFDMQSSFFTSLVLVLLLFLFVYRRWITLLFVGLPLFGGIQLTMGIAALTLGSLNILTSAFAAILVGLGIDFAVHLYDRYQQERTVGADIASAIEITLTQTGEGIWTGAFTTIFAFGTLYFSRVRGIVELAFLVSTGLICALLCIYFVLPSFLVWIDQRKKAHPYRGIQTLQFNNLSSFLERKGRLAFFVLIGTSLLFLVFAFGIEVERDFRNLKPKEIKSLEILDRMAKAFGGRKLEALAIHEEKDLTSLLVKEEKTIKTFERFQKDGKIDSFVSLCQLIPSPDEQKRRAEAIRQSIDLKRVRENLIKALKENGFETSRFQDLLQNLEEMSRGHEKIHSPETLIGFIGQSPLRKGVEPFLTQKGEIYRVVSHLFYQKGNLALDQLEREIPGVSITGPERVESEILKVVKEDLFILTPFSFVIILLLVLSHFRTWKITLLTLTPLVMGLVWMLGAMALLDIRINFINAVILPMIIGMGIDNSVHLMHRYLEEGGEIPFMPYVPQEGL